MIDTLLVALIVGLAAIWVGRRFYTSFRQGSQCGCECGGCTIPEDCPESVQIHPAEKKSVPR